VIQSTLPSDPIFAIAVVLGIGIMGGIASVVRVSIASWRGFLPWGTMTVNTVAAVAIGFWFAFFPNESTVGWVTAIIALGFAGGLSTFSTLMSDMVFYFQRGRMMQMIFSAAGNIFIPLTGLLVITASF